MIHLPLPSLSVGEAGRAWPWLGKCLGPQWQSQLVPATVPLETSCRRQMPLTRSGPDCGRVLWPTSLRTRAVALWLSQLPATMLLLPKQRC